MAGKHLLGHAGIVWPVVEKAVQQLGQCSVHGLGVEPAAKGRHEYPVANVRPYVLAYKNKTLQDVSDRKQNTFLTHECREGDDTAQPLLPATKPGRKQQLTECPEESRHMLTYTKAEG